MPNYDFILTTSINIVMNCSGACDKDMKGACCKVAKGARCKNVRGAHDMVAQGARYKDIQGARDRHAQAKFSGTQRQTWQFRINSINQTLFDAISRGSLQSMIFLISMGADIEALMCKSWSRPLLHACYVLHDTDHESKKWKNTDEMVKILLDEGADIAAR